MLYQGSLSVHAPASQPSGTIVQLAAIFHNIISNGRCTDRHADNTRIKVQQPRSQAIFCEGGKKRSGIICSRLCELPWELEYAWIFSMYFIVLFRYLPAYVQRMMAESDVCACCCL